MNLAHRWLCRSDSWRNVVETYIAPWALEGVDLGSHVLEVGPGPGVKTDLLRTRVRHLTCVEIDRGFADALARRWGTPPSEPRGEECRGVVSRIVASWKRLDDWLRRLDSLRKRLDDRRFPQ